MSYIGNQITTAFTSMDKQDITGNGGTSYTLSHSVANANEIEVFVNNVRQEPTVAYSVSGTTLTMTGNVASTDSFYVVYQGKAVGTIVTPDGSVSSAKLDTNIAVAGNLDVGTIRSTNGTTAATIDASGIITKPNQPSFTGHLTSNQALTAYQANFLTGFTCPSHGNVGSHFNTSNGRFTAPVTGFYLFTGAVQCDLSNAIHIAFYMNGAAYEADSWINQGASLGGYATRIMYLTTNQYVNLTVLPTATTNASANRTRFQGYLLG